VVSEAMVGPGFTDGKKRSMTGKPSATQSVTMSMRNREERGNDKSELDRSERAEVCTMQDGLGECIVGVSRCLPSAGIARYVIVDESGSAACRRDTALMTAESIFGSQRSEANVHSRFACQRVRGHRPRSRLPGYPPLGVR